jgi:hypothetical protein
MLPNKYVGLRQDDAFASSRRCPAPNVVIAEIYLIYSAFIFLLRDACVEVPAGLTYLNYQFISNFVASVSAPFLSPA